MPELSDVLAGLSVDSSVSGAETTFGLDGGVLKSLSASAIRGAVPVSAFGTVDDPFNGNNTGNDAVPIQAAIDYAVANGRSVISCPDGATCRTTEPVFLDPPNNLRVDLDTPPGGAAFSLALVGPPKYPNHEGNYGFRIKPATNDFVALWVGPGQSMSVQGIDIIGPSAGGAAGYRGGQSSDGIGIALAGGGGGTRFWVDRCEIANIYRGIMTSANGNGALGDSNTISNCFITNVHTCIDIGGSVGTQNFINAVRDLTASSFQIGINAVLGTGCRVDGGNISPVSARGAKLGMSNVSAITATASDNAKILSFTAEIEPDDYMAALIYNACAIVTDSYGVVPVVPISYDTGTDTATFEVLRNFIFSIYPQGNPLSISSTLEDEIQAATELWCAEFPVVFSGAGFTVDRVHIEMSSAGCCALINSGSGFGSNRTSHLRGIYFNSDAAQPNYSPQVSSDDSEKARFYNAATHPFIAIDNIDCYISDSELGIESSPVVVDIHDGSNKIWLDRVGKFIANVRTYGQGYGEPTEKLGSQAFAGGVVSDKPYFNTLDTSDTLATRWRKTAWGTSPFWGYRPAPYTTPVITPAQLTALGSLPSITYSSGNFTVGYPLLWGGQIYRVNDWYLGAPANYHLASDHHFYTYGQDLTTTNVPNLAWEYLGGSSVVYANAELLRILFPGLGVILNDGGSDVLYIVVGVYPELGYFVVNIADSRGNPVDLLSGSGTKNGTTVKQEAFDITSF